MRGFEDALAELGRRLDILTEQSIHGARRGTEWSKERLADLERWWGGASARGRLGTVGLVVVVGAAAMAGAAWTAAALFAEDLTEVTAEDRAVLESLEGQMRELGASVSHPSTPASKRHITPR
ncbi:MAG: hypothetical protein KF699_07990 [Phycisphaeraceae bacterium]|nr:hypothetical protein [Phycisphaeraceae bacterium]